MKKTTHSTAFLIATIIVGLFLFSPVHFGTAQSGSNVSGILTSDTTWIKTNSPYTLTGNVLVNIGVTLTIEAGTTVNINNYYLQIDGCIVAQGSNTDKIYFNAISGIMRGQISFTQSSRSWDEQNRTGSIIENAILSQTAIDIKNASPKINNNYFEGHYVQTNTITIDGGQPIISNNTFVGQGYMLPLSCIKCYGLNKTLISENLITGAFAEGISAGSAIVEGNLISGSNDGIVVGFTTSETSLIENNTIINNKVGFRIMSSSFPSGNTIILTKIQNNNVNNNNYNAYVNFQALGKSIDLSNNWWGTTNAQSIAQTIYDSKNDFNLPTVTFTPFLTEPNPAAALIPSFNILASAEAGGIISPAGNLNVNLGNNQSFTITANTGYHIASVKVNGNSVGTVSTYTFTNVQSANTIIAEFALNPTPTPIITPAPTPNPTTTLPTPTPTTVPSLNSTQLSISADVSSAAVGASVNINGKLSSTNGKPLPNKAITLSYTLSGSSNNIPIGSDITTTDGEYNLQWVNTASGTFTLKVEWSGDAIYQPTSNVTVLNFLPYQNQNVFLVESNSTVYALAFNSTSSELSFSVTGPSGTTGYVKTTIAKNLISNPENLKVYLDGNQLNYIVTSNADSWQLTFNYQHSTHKVSIVLTAGTSVPEFSILILPFFIVLTLIGSFLLKTKILKKK